MGSVKLSTPLLRVVLHEDDDTEVTVQTVNADLLLFERTAKRHKWGSIGDNPITFQTFIAWSALRRRKVIDDGVTFEAFSQTCGSIEVVDDEDDPDAEAHPGTPTRPDPGSG